jgi:hypothetical protein
MQAGLIKTLEVQLKPSAMRVFRTLYPPKTVFST